MKETISTNNILLFKGFSEKIVMLAQEYDFSSVGKITLEM